MRMFLIAALLVAAPLAAQEQEEVQAENLQVVDAIRQLEESIPAATREMIDLARAEAGPVVWMYYEGAMRRQKIYSVVIAAFGLLAVIGALPIVYAIRKRDCDKDFYVIVGLLVAVGVGCWIAAAAKFANADFAALHYTMSRLSDFVPGG